MRWLNLWNLTDVATYLLQVIFASTDSAWYKLLQAASDELSACGQLLPDDQDQHQLQLRQCGVRAAQKAEGASGVQGQVWLGFD